MLNNTVVYLSEENNRHNLKMDLKQSLEEALLKNDQEKRLCSDYIQDLTHATNNLTSFQCHLEVDVMVPIGNKALMPGVLYHTNEVLISHLNGIYIETSAQKAIEVVQARLRAANEQLKALQDEASLYKSKLEFPQEHPVFPNTNQREIIEEYDEETEKQWRVQHRQRVREYKQQMSIDRDKLKDDSDILEQLDELELLEELEDELGSVVNRPPQLEAEIQLKDDSRHIHNVVHFQEELSETPLEKAKDSAKDSSITPKKRRSLQFSDTERVQLIHKNERPNSLRPNYDPELTLQIKFKHTPLEFHPPANVIHNTSPNSPWEIYKAFPQFMKCSTTNTPEEMPKSILKKTTNAILVDRGAKLVSNNDPEQEEIDIDFINNNIYSPIVGEVIERMTEDNKKTELPKSKDKKISRFKASRN